MAMIMSIGLKGGVGKSTNMRLFIEIIRQKGMKVAVFDSDRTNADVYRYLAEKGPDGIEPLPEQNVLNGVKRVSLKNKDDIKTFVNYLSEVVETHKDLQHIIVDFAATGEGSYQELEEKFPQFERAMKLIGDDELIFIFSMGDTTNSPTQLANTLNRYASKAKFIIVRSAHFPEPFYDKTPLPEFIKKLNGIEVTTPDWPRELCQHLDPINGRFYSITKRGCGLAIADVAEAQDFWERTVEAFKPATDFLKGKQNADKN